MKLAYGVQSSARDSPPPAVTDPVDLHVRKHIPAQRSINDSEIVCAHHEPVFNGIKKPGKGTMIHAEFADALGTSPARLTNALGRLIAFHLAYTIPAQPATLFIKRRAPTLNPEQLARLAQQCPTLAASHDEQLAA
jgi:hypothetical protein